MIETNARIAAVLAAAKQSQINNRLLRIHWNSGEIGNPHKLSNHAIMGLLCPEFVPQLVVPTNSQLEEVSDIPIPVFPSVDLGWEKWSSFLERKGLGLEAHLSIGLEASRQLHHALNRFGIIIRDRHQGNIMLIETNKKTSIFFKGKYFRVFQTDMGILYDVVSDKQFLDPGIDYFTRKLPIEIANRPKTSINQATVTMAILGNVLKNIRNAEMRRRNITGLKMLADQQNEWSRQYDSFKYQDITFANLVDVLNSVSSKVVSTV